MRRFDCLRFDDLVRLGSNKSPGTSSTNESRNSSGSNTLFGGSLLSILEYYLFFMICLVVPACWLLFMCYHDDGDNVGDYVVNERTEA